jgi:hypothetical protein
MMAKAGLSLSTPQKYDAASLHLNCRGIIDSIFAKNPFPNRGRPSMMRELG